MISDDEIPTVVKQAQTKDTHGMRARNRLQRHNDRAISFNLDKREFKIRGDEYSNDQDKALMSAFHHMLDDPVVKRFKRNQIKLYKTTNLDFLHINKNIDGAEIRDGKYIMIPSAFDDILNENEFKALLAHEMGHHLRLDSHPKAKRNTGLFQREDFADKFAVYITKDPDSLKSALQKLEAYVKDEAKFKLPFHIIIDPVKTAIALKTNEMLRAMYKPIAGYRSAESREAFIGQCGQRLLSEAGVQELRDEIISELETRHKKVFPKQFARDLQNTRAAESRDSFTR